MKIYKVEIDAKNPIEKIVKVPFNSDYNLDISWCDKIYKQTSTCHEATLKTTFTTKCGTYSYCYENAESYTEPDAKHAAMFKAEDSSGSLPQVSKERPEITFKPALFTQKDPSSSGRGYSWVKYDFNNIKVIGIDEDYYDVNGGAALDGISSGPCGTIISGSPIVFTGNLVDFCSMNTKISGCVIFAQSSKWFFDTKQICITKFLADYGM